MKKRSVAIFVARETFTWLVFSSLLLAPWWLPTFGDQFGIGHIDAAPRVVGILTGIWFIVTGNRVPKRTLPSSHENAAVLQGFQRFIGWACVLTGAVFLVCWLTLPLDLAFYVSNVSGPMLFFAAMFLLWRRVRHLKGEPRAI